MGLDGRVWCRGNVSVKNMHLIGPEWLTWVVAFGFVFTLWSTYDGNLVYSIPEYCTPDSFPFRSGHRKVKLLGGLSTEVDQ